MQMDKTSARLLLNTSLPVPSDVLSGHQKALVQIGQRARQLRRGVSMTLSGKVPIDYTVSLAALTPIP